MSFTEKNLIPIAGLLPAAVLAQRIGLGERRGSQDGDLRLGRHRAAPAPHLAAPAAGLVAGLVTDRPKDRVREPGVQRPALTQAVHVAPGRLPPDSTHPPATPHSDVLPAHSPNGRKVLFASDRRYDDF